MGGELGVQPPFGFWDPLGFASDGDVEVFKRRRAIEIKHGRVSMIACLGYITPEYVRFCGFVDFALFRADPARDPGDFEKAGVLGVPNASGPMTDAEALKRKLNAELANGRLAMMAIIGMFYQDGLTGSAWGDWSLYVDSPLRAS